MRSGQELQASQGTPGQGDYSWALPALVDIPIMLFFFFQKLMSFLKARKSKRSCKGDRTAAYTLVTHQVVSGTLGTDPGSARHVHHLSNLSLHMSHRPEWWTLKGDLNGAFLKHTSLTQIPGRIPWGVTIQVTQPRPQAITWNSVVSHCVASYSHP